MWKCIALISQVAGLLTIWRGLNYVMIQVPIFISDIFLKSNYNSSHTDRLAQQCITALVLIYIYIYIYINIYINIYIYIYIYIY